MTEEKLDKTAVSVRLLNVIKKQLLRDKPTEDRQESSVDDELVELVMDLLDVPNEKEFEDLYANEENVPDRFGCLSLILDGLSDNIPADELVVLVRKSWSKSALIEELGL